MSSATPGRTVLLTATTLVAFAGNSILCRMALKDGAIDPIAFTSIRLASGAFILGVIVQLRSQSLFSLRPIRWKPAAALSSYAITFSLAYVSIEAGVGALLLFSAVQVTMISVAVVRGSRPGVTEWAGITTAIGGLGLLLAPGLTAPSLTGALLMLVSGISWGVYSLLGQGESDPVAATSRNFLLATPFAAVLVFVPTGFDVLTMHGVGLAVASGAITSGLGYVIWYAALQHLSITVAAIAQLAVPVIAALGGIMLMGETLTPRFLLASALILGGIYLTVHGADHQRS